ncbi:MAG: hypothetical protein U5J96_14475 [Ignavibacteriaceae bacterium]|nr:hypothetical protein [Ignavibacteriaceae bacterium]
MSTIINGSPYTIVSSIKTIQVMINADYIKQKLNSYGLQLYQWFSGTGRNVYSTTGNRIPKSTIYICTLEICLEHAPGADDNGSGTAAVIEAARIFSNYTFPFTIIYLCGMRKNKD